MRLSTGSSWRLNIGQIYQTLASLRRAGLIVPVPRPDHPDSPARCTYGITPKGVRALDRWRRGGATRLRPVRDEILLRLLAPTSFRWSRSRSASIGSNCRHSAIGGLWHGAIRSALH